MIEAYFMLSGRMRRLPYFGYSLLLLVIVLIIGAVFAGQLSGAGRPITATIIVVVALSLLLAGAGTALGVKRCHDLDKSGWLYLWIVFLPGVLSSTFSIEINGVSSEFHLPVISGIAGLVAFLGGLYLLFARGTDGPNKYGYPPESL